MVLKLLIVIGK